MRKILDNKINIYETLTPRENQVAIFIVGSNNRAAVHSEPAIDGPRIFFSIVVGNKNQIKEMATRRNMEFIDGKYHK